MLLRERACRRRDDRGAGTWKVQMGVMEKEVANAKAEAAVLREELQRLRAGGWSEGQDESRENPAADKVMACIELAAVSCCTVLVIPSEFSRFAAGLCGGLQLAEVKAELEEARARVVELERDGENVTEEVKNAVWIFA